MATALARGWGRPVLVADPAPGRAERLVAELGGEVLDDNVLLARRAETILLAHKPEQLETVAAEIAPLTAGKTVISILGGVGVARLEAAYPDANVVRTIPNTPSEVRRGVTCIAEGGESAVELFEQVGRVFVVPESQVDVAMSVMSVAPAYVALVAEAAVDAAVQAGLPAPQATDMFLATLAGTAELIEARGGDTLAVRRSVTSPGGSTARGLAELERHGLRTAFAEATRAVLRR